MRRRTASSSGALISLMGRAPSHGNTSAAKRRVISPPWPAPHRGACLLRHSCDGLKRVRLGGLPRPSWRRWGLCRARRLTITKAHAGRAGRRHNWVTEARTSFEMGLTAVNRGRIGKLQFWCTSCLVVMNHPRQNTWGRRWRAGSRAPVLAPPVRGAWCLKAASAPTPLLKPLLLHWFGGL